MRTRFSIDTATGAISRFNLGAAVPPALVLVFTARDIIECEVVFTAGGSDVTTTVLAEGVLMRLGLRQNTSDGPLLAMSDPYTLESGVAKCVLNLNTQEIVDLVAALPLTARSAKVYFECEISAGDGSFRETITQAQATLQCEVNEEADEPPEAAAESAATAAAQAVIATTQAGIATTKAGEAAASAAAAATSTINAATSEANALASKNAAATSATNAATSEGNALASKNAAATSATNAATSETNALASKNAAATSATNAATSEANALTYKNAAAASATSASASQTAIQNAAGNFLGLVAGNAVPAAPGSPNNTAGKYYIISSAGTSQGITWAFGDWAIYSGTSGSWSRLPAGAVDRIMLANVANARAQLPGLVFTGISGASSTISLTGNISADILCDVPATNPSTALGLLALGGDYGGIGPSIHVFIETTGSLSITAFDVSTSNFRTVKCPLVASFGGKRVSISFGIQSGAISVYVDDIAQAMTETTSGTPPTWGQMTMYSTAVYVGKLTAANYAPFSSFLKVWIYNLTLSQADFVARHANGGPLQEDFNNAGNTALNTGNFSGTASLTGASATGVTADITVSNQWVACSPVFSIRKGSKYLVKYDLTLNSGTAPLVELANPSVANYGYQAGSPVGAGITIVMVGGANASNARVNFFSSVASNFTIANFSVIPLGLTGGWDLSSLLITSTSAPALPQVNCGSLTWGSGVTPSTPSSGVIPGTPTNDNAPAGARGEFVSNSLAAGSAVALTTSTPANVTSISLTAGDWDVEGVVHFAGGATTGTQSIGAISTTSGTLPNTTDDRQLAYSTQMPVATTSVSVRTPSVRLSLSATATVYLIGRMTFTAGTPTAFGFIRARRAR